MTFFKISLITYSFLKYKSDLNEFKSKSEKECEEFAICVWHCTKRKKIKLLDNHNQ